jgi:hypothetical protein
MSAITSSVRGNGANARWIGGLAVAVGVGAVLFTNQGIASADSPSTSSSDSNSAATAGPSKPSAAPSASTTTSTSIGWKRKKDRSHIPVRNGAAQIDAATPTGPLTSPSVPGLTTSKGPHGKAAGTATTVGQSSRVPHYRLDLKKDLPPNPKIASLSGANDTRIES